MIRPTSIRHQLAALTVVVAVPLVGAMLYATYTARSNARATAQRSTIQLAAVTASSVEQFLGEVRFQMARIAARPSIQQYESAGCDPILSVAHDLNRYTANVAIEDLRGRIVCSAVPRPPGGPPSVARSEWFQRARATGRFTVGEPFLGTITHRLVSVLVLPITRAGHRVGYISFPIDLVRFQTFFTGLSGLSSSLVAIVTESGQIVARSQDAERFVGTRVSADVHADLRTAPRSAVGVDGVKRLYAGRPVRGTSWVVRAGVPVSVAYGPSDRLMRTLVVVSAVLLVLAFFAAMFAGRWIAGPVEALARRARDIAEGRDHFEEPPRGPYEVAIASQRLDEMVLALGETERLLAQSLEAAGMAAWAIDLVTGESWRSAAHDRIYGHDETLPDWNFEIALAHIVPDCREEYRAALALALETGRLGHVCQVAWPDGSEHWLRLEGRVKYDADGKPVGVSGTVVDVSETVHNEQERLRLEEQLRQSQKMDAIGQLAGGVAHDFNNLLTAICGYCELALGRVATADTALRRDIEQIARAGEQAAQLTRQLLAFSRRQTLQPTVFDLNAVVSDAQVLVRRLLGEHVDIISSIAPVECSVRADRAQVEQILVNLALNARDAMPGGGTLTIETELVSWDGAEGRPVDAPSGPYALLRVSDTGCGMDAETRERAFEPFFTTKPIGEGTGLGLSTVFGSVQQSGGHIVLRSDVGQGTMFEIAFPLVEAAIEPIAVPPANEPNGGGEKILLVEDDPTVRQLARAILVAGGYHVTTAVDGQDALQLASTPFDLLVTDIVMPKLNGTELAVRLRARRPTLPVVFMSGYSYEVTGGDLTAADAFIAKPFLPHDLTAIVRQTLDRALALSV